MIKVSVSSLPYNDNIIENLDQIINSGADFLHLDIMDGSLTKNKTFLNEKVAEINSKTTFFLDCHLMINEPFEFVKDYLKAGANIVTVHYEAFSDKEKLIETLELIKSKNRLAGLSIFPNTNLEEIKELTMYFDVLLIMSVEIGNYGQSFIENTYQKLEKARKMFKDKLIEIDGGVKLENSRKLSKLGADILVVGSSYFKSENKGEFITKLKS